MENSSNESNMFHHDNEKIAKEFVDEILENVREQMEEENEFVLQNFEVPKLKKF